MSAVLLVPLFPLLAALIVVIGRDATLQVRAKIAAWPIGAAFCGAIATLYFVATQGPISLRLYDPASAASFAVPFGLYVDRLSAVMMTLISGVGTIIYVYSIGYLYQDPQERHVADPQERKGSIGTCQGCGMSVVMGQEIEQITQELPKHKEHD